MHSFAFALAYLAAAIGTSVVVPQLVRTIRHPHLTGVSPLSWAFVAASCTAWIVYGIRASILPQVPGNVLLASGAIALVLLVPSRSSWRVRAVVLGAAIAVVVTASLVVSPEVAGFIGFGIGLFSAWPQLVDSYATWRRAEVSGVAVGTWGVRLLASVLWFTYAVITHDVPVLAASTIGFATTIAVLSFELSARRRAARTPSLDRPTLDRPALEGPATVELTPVPA